MPRGPLPQAERRRTNSPTIPTTNLPAGGRQGAAPRPPKWVRLGEAGRGWWRWAWSTPQACAWSAGDSPVVARRASLEDVLAFESDTKARLAVSKEMLQIEDRLGLTPRAMAQLRWKIVDEAGAAGVEPAAAPARRLKVVAQ